MVAGVFKCMTTVSLIFFLYPWALPLAGAESNCVADGVW
jgi:hypothetical protein